MSGMSTVMHVAQRIADLKKLREILCEERKAGRDLEPMKLDNGETVHFCFKRTE